MKRITTAINLNLPFHSLFRSSSKSFLTIVDSPHSKQFCPQLTLSLLFYRFPRIAKYEISPSYVTKNWAYNMSDGDICACWFIVVLFIGFRSAQTIYVTRPHESNLLESPKWVGLQNMFCIGISHCQYTLSVLMYWLWEGRLPFTGVYSFYKARQLT